MSILVSADHQRAINIADYVTIVALSTAGYQLLVYTEDYDVFCAVYSGHYYIDTELGPRCVVFTAPSTDDTHGEAADQIGIMEQDYDFDMTDYCECTRVQNPCRDCC